MKKYTLTEEHREQLKPWAAKWIANAMSTKAMDESDREKAIKAANGLYEAAGLTVPKRIVFVPSPFALRFAGGFAAAIWHIRKYGNAATFAATRDATRDATVDATDDATYAATDAATRDATVDATVDATYDATHDATDAATYAATRDATRDATVDATDDATYAATRDATYAATVAATFDATRDATDDDTYAATFAATVDATDDDTYAATFAATRAATYDATYDSARDAARDATEAAWYKFKCTIPNAFALKCAQQSCRMWHGGNQLSAWVSFISFFRHVTKLPVDYSKWQHWETLAEVSGPRIVHPEFCMISDRPELLTVDSENRPHNDTGPFCRWRDGSALYAVHGVRVPWWIVEHPERITFENIESESNAEVRRVMTEKYGAARYIMDSGAVEIERDDYGTLYRKDVPGDEPIVMVNVVNSTPEPDGSFKDYFLRVPPGITTAHEAVAWSFGKTSETYAPMIET